MSHYSVTSGLPAPQGLYDPRNEHDACGIGFVANIKGQKSHDIIVKGIQILINLTHRGACGCDPETGDGAGVLIQIPHAIFRARVRRTGLHPSPRRRIRRRHDLPARGAAASACSCEGIIERIVREEGLTVLGWRDTPIDGTPSAASRAAPSPTSSRFSSRAPRA